jgi:hypothetical protein
MLDNQTRRELLSKARQSGFPGSILDVFTAYEQGKDIIGEFQQQQQQQQGQQMSDMAAQQAGMMAPGQQPLPQEMPQAPAGPPPGLQGQQLPSPPPPSNPNLVDSTQQQPVGMATNAKGSSGGQVLMANGGFVEKFTEDQYNKFSSHFPFSKEQRESIAHRATVENPDLTMVRPKKYVFGGLKYALGGFKYEDGGIKNPNYKPSYDFTKSTAENIELNKRAETMGWNSIEEYKNSNWGQNQLALKQQALINNPEVQKMAKTAAEMRPDLAKATSQVSQKKDVLSANNTSPTQKIVNQAYYATSNPAEALGHYSRYGYMPQGNIGNYGHKDAGSGMSTVINYANPGAWLNGFYRFSNDVPQKESWTTIGGATNMIADALDATPLLEAANPTAKGLYKTGKYFAKSGKSAFRNSHIGALGEEIKGTLKIPKAERQAALQKGNDFSTMWAQHPETNAKMDAIFKEKVANAVKSVEETFPNASKQYKNEMVKSTLEFSSAGELAEGFKQAVKYTGNSGELPLHGQLADLLFTGKVPHKGNYGFTYRHGFSPKQKTEMLKDPKMSYDLYSRNWVSRTPQSSYANRASTAVHENTHDWIPEETLKLSGQYDLIKEQRSNLFNDIYGQWKGLRAEGKTSKEIAEIMGKEKAHMGYLLNPTEMHARIMQLRHEMKAVPGKKLSEAGAAKLYKMIDEGETSVEPLFLRGVKNPESLRALYNDLLTPAAVVGGTGYLYNREKKPLLNYKL